MVIVKKRLQGHDFGAHKLCIFVYYNFWQANAFSPYLKHNPASNPTEWRQQQ
jgi:hypothetical protein